MGTLNKCRFHAKSLVWLGNPLAVRKTTGFRKPVRDIGKRTVNEPRTTCLVLPPPVILLVQIVLNTSTFRSEILTDGFPSPILQVSDPEKGIFGIAQHSDFGVLTLLATVRNLKIIQAVYWISCSDLLSLRTRRCNT